MDKRLSVIEFLQWNDRNGSFRDDMVEEGMQPLTYEETVQYFFWFLNEDLYSENALEITFEEMMELARDKGVYDKTMKLLQMVIDNPSEGTFRKVIDNI